MGTKSRNIMMIASGLVISALVWGAVAAQDATSTVEPPVSTEQATAQATAEATMMSPTTTTAPSTEQAPMATAMPSTASTHGFLGVALQDSANGVTVAQVVPGSGAATAGIQVGDVITAINGTSVSTAASAASVVSALQVGASVSIDLTRSGSKMTVTATLGAPTTPAQPINPNGQNNPPGTAGQGRGFGFTYNPQTQAWTITNLSSDSSLYTAGLRQGDVINTIDGKTYTPATLLEYIRGLAQDAKVTLSVTRDGAAQDIQVSASDLVSLFGRMGGNGFLGGNGNGNGNGNGGAMAQVSPLLEMVAKAGHLGITYERIDAQLAQQNSLTVTDGALVTAVEAGSPAETAGLKVNDVITAVDGTKVDAKRPLVYLLLPYQSGDVVTLSVLRAGQTMDVQATLTQSQNMMFGGGMFPFMMPFGGRGPFGGNGNGNGGSLNNAPGQNQSQATPEATPNA